jgi:superfamily I DNA/RNA helicase
VPLGDVAILYRTNRMAQLLEPAIKNAGIPYTVVGGMSFYERAEIKAARAVATLGCKPGDFLQLKNLQPYIDGVGEAGLNQYLEAMKDNEMNCLDVAMMPGDGALHYGKRGLQLQDFLKSLYLMHLEIVDEDMYPGQATRHMVDWMINGPMKILEREKDDVLQKRREEHLERLCHEVQENAPEDWMAYMMDAPISDYMLSDDKGETLTLSTVHRSKGLEWPHVMIAGFSDGLMPLDRDRLNGKPPRRPEDMSADDRARALSQKEEERRLVYVALTRGAESVWLGHANEMRFAGSEPMLLNVSPAAHEMGMELTPHNKMVLSIHNDESESMNGGNDILASARLA